MGSEIEPVKPVIAAFDFDGTITTRDTLPVFIWHAVSLIRIIAGTIITTPFLALYKLKFIPNYKAKEQLFRGVFSGVGIDKFTTICERFSRVVETIVRPQALSKIKWHQEQGHQVIIISASAENWIRPWAATYGIDVILGTQLEVKNNRITGKFLTRNCYGQEKVQRLLENFPDRENYELYAYGDSNGDKELLASADHPFYRTF